MPYTCSICDLMRFSDDTYNVATIQDRTYNYACISWIPLIAIVLPQPVVSRSWYIGVMIYISRVTGLMASTIHYIANTIYIICVTTTKVSMGHYITNTIHHNRVTAMAGITVLCGDPRWRDIIIDVYHEYDNSRSCYCGGDVWGYENTIGSITGQI